MVLLCLFSLFLTTVFCQTRTTWQYQIGPILPNPTPGTPTLDPTVQEAALDMTPIPGPETVWSDCYSDDVYCPSATSLQVGTVPSRLNTCWVDFAYSFYQTYITVPVGVTVTNFQIIFLDNIIDDGAIVTIYNALYPTGQKLTYVGFRSSQTVDLSASVTTGVNRLVISQVDTCATENKIRAVIQLNGVPLNPTCENHPNHPCDTYIFNGVDCVPVPNPDGSACDDADPCTTNDVCSATVCAGTPIVCTPLDQCHVAGVCEAGVCTNPEKCDGKRCDDGNACTQLDTCKAGVCVGKKPVICTVENDCQEAGTCDPATGNCTAPDNQCDGTGCDDGNKCTLTDSCLDGECVGSGLRVCDAPDQCHEGGECDIATGACNNKQKADGTPCDDGNACTQSDTCRAGVCVGKNPKVCKATDSCHVDGVCDIATGECSTVAKADGTSCNDGDKCTETDTCQAGKCVGSGQVCCRTSGNRCGTCVRDCRGSHPFVLNLFKLWRSEESHQGGPDDVDTGLGGGCPSGKVCCVPRDQSTCRNDNNSCRIPDGGEHHD